MGNELTVQGLRNLERCKKVGCNYQSGEKCFRVKIGHLNDVSKCGKWEDKHHTCPAMGCSGELSRHVSKAKLVYMHNNEMEADDVEIYICSECGIGVSMSDG